MTPAQLTLFERTRERWLLNPDLWVRYLDSMAPMSERSADQEALVEKYYVQQERLKKNAERRKRLMAELDFLDREDAVIQADLVAEADLPNF